MQTQTNTVEEESIREQAQILSLEAHQTIPEGYKLKRGNSGLPILEQGKYLLEKTETQSA